MHFDERFPVSCQIQQRMIVLKTWLLISETRKKNCFWLGKKLIQQNFVEFGKKEESISLVCWVFTFFLVFRNVQTFWKSKNSKLFFLNKYFNFFLFKSYIEIKKCFSAFNLVIFFMVSNDLFICTRWQMGSSFLQKILFVNQLLKISKRKEFVSS